MVEVTLKQERIDAGAALVRRLDAVGMQLDAAFWFYFPDIDAWKLVIAEVKVAKKGPKQVYREIQKLLRKYGSDFPELSLEDVTLAKPGAPIVSLLKVALKTGPGMSGIRFTDNVINGMHIDDAYIYRLQ